MNILHVTPSYYPATWYGGPIFATWHMNNALQELPGTSLRVLTTDAAGPRRLTKRETAVGAVYEIVFTRRVASNSFAPGLLGRLGPMVAWADVVHLTALYSFPTIPVLMACRAMGKPVVWSLHGTLLGDQNRNLYDSQSATKMMVKRLWNSLCQPYAKSGKVAIHVTTEQEFKASRQVFSKARFLVVPNGVEVPETLTVKREWQPNGQLRLLFIGRIAPVKGLENLLHGMTKLGPQVRLNICGAGAPDYVHKIETITEELRLRDRVAFAGHVEGEEKDRVFAETDVCVVPSYSENFCIVVAEALAHGVPVIVSDHLAWEKVTEVGCGLVVPNDAKSLSTAIKEISRMELWEMGRRGREWVRDEYEWSAVASQMLNEYSNMVGHVL